MIDRISVPLSIYLLRVSPDGSALVVVGDAVGGAGIALINLSQLH